MTTTLLESISNGTHAETSPSQKRVLLLKPRGFCAGVVRAIDIVKIALETFGAPSTSAARLSITAMLSMSWQKRARSSSMRSTMCPTASGSSTRRTASRPRCARSSKGRGLKVIDATCPLVTKVHIEAVKFAKQGYSLVLIGHRDHDEIEGTLGEAPEVTQVVSNVAEVAALGCPTRTAWPI